MGFVSSKLSGISTETACGRLSPLMVRNSRTLSRLAESLISGWTIGVMSPMSPNRPELSTLWRACIQLRLPRMVLISPLWQSIRKGCARLHCGNVFVEKREWTIAIALVNHWLVRSV